MEKRKIERLMEDNKLYSNVMLLAQEDLTKCRKTIEILLPFINQDDIEDLIAELYDLRIENKTLKPIGVARDIRLAVQKDLKTQKSTKPSKKRKGA